MSKSQPSPTTSQVSKPPSQEETIQNPAQTLAWIEAQITSIYSTTRAGQQENSTPALDRSTYVGIYNAIHNYCTTGKTADKNDDNPSTRARELYRILEREIRIYCHETRVYIFSPNNNADADAAHALLTTYMAQWKKFMRLARFIKNLMQFVERHFIKREIDERKQDVHLILDLHKMIWKEEVLRVDVDTEPVTSGLQEIEDAVAMVRKRGGGETESGNELVDTVVEFLSSLGLTLGGEAD